MLRRIINITATTQITTGIIVLLASKAVTRVEDGREPVIRVVLPPSATMS
jgi:hypothetical protein